MHECHVLTGVCSITGRSVYETSLLNRGGRTKKNALSIYLQVLGHVPSNE